MGFVLGWGDGCLKRLGAALCAAAVTLLSLSGCSTLPKGVGQSSAPPASKPENPVSRPEEPLDLTLCYSSEDSLNPYKAKTQVNVQLASLLYDSLTVLDEQWQPQLSLAASVSREDPLRYRVTLRENAAFSDGSAVTAADVAASFQQAKASQTYRSLLLNLLSCTVEAGAAVFTLAAPDPQFSACLTFPILKQGTDDAPVGGGRYVLEEGERPRLVWNSRYEGEPSTDTIYLRYLSDRDSMIRGLETGVVSYYFDDLSNGEIPRISSASANIPLPNLVFLGFNSEREAVSDPAVRRAVDAAVSRAAIADSSFAGRAVAAQSPFPSAWEPAVEIKGFETVENIQAAVAQLEQAGYNTKGAAGQGEPLSLTLLCSDSNSFRLAAAKQLEEQLEKTGIAVTVESMSFSDLEKRLDKGDFDLYIGEIRLSANMSLSPLLTEGGAAAYGIDQAGAAAQAYAAYLAGEKTLADFCAAFVQDPPFLPLCWRQGIAAYDRNMSGVTPTAFDVYHGIEGWTLPSLS